MGVHFTCRLKPVQEDGLAVRTVLSTPRKILRQEGGQQRILLLGERNKLNVLTQEWERGKGISKVIAKDKFTLRNMGWEGSLLQDRNGKGINVHVLHDICTAYTVVQKRQLTAAYGYCLADGYEVAWKESEYIFIYTTNNTRLHMRVLIFITGRYKSFAP